jgi:hypothetical protein
MEKVQEPINHTKLLRELRYKFKQFLGLGARRRWWPGMSTGFTPPAPWDSAPMSVDGVWLRGWYVACGGGGVEISMSRSASGIPWCL